MVCVQPMITFLLCLPIWFSVYSLLLSAVMCRTLMCRLGIRVYVSDPFTNLSMSLSCFIVSIVSTVRLGESERYNECLFCAFCFV